MGETLVCTSAGTLESAKNRCHRISVRSRAHQAHANVLEVIFFARARRRYVGSGTVCSKPARTRHGDANSEVVTQPAKVSHSAAQSGLVWSAHPAHSSRKISGAELDDH